MPDRDSAEANPVRWLLALEDDHTSGGKDVPRPIALRPPIDAQANPLEFALVFYGRAHYYIPHVISAVQAMSRIGVGADRAPFTIESIEAVDPLMHTAQPLLDMTGQQVASLPNPPGAEAYQRFAAALDPTTVTVEFLTPTRIVDRKRLCRTPVFRPWFQRLLERTRLISELYMPEPVWVPFGDLLAVARTVKLVEADAHWEERWSGSRRTDSYQPTSGYVGTAQYRAPGEALQILLPWILLGQGLQVGKTHDQGQWLVSCTIRVALK